MRRQKYQASNILNEYGLPSGGSAKGLGFEINWQNGPLKEGEENGAFVQTIIDVLIERMEFFQESKFKCRENSLAITKLQEALHWLDARSNRRKLEGVEVRIKEI